MSLQCLLGALVVVLEPLAQIPVETHGPALALLSRSFRAISVAREMKSVDISSLSFIPMLGRMTRVVVTPCPTPIPWDEVGKVMVTPHMRRILVHLRPLFVGRFINVFTSIFVDINEDLNYQDSMDSLLTAASQYLEESGDKGADLRGFCHTHKSLPKIYLGIAQIIDALPSEPEMLIELASTLAKTCRKKAVQNNMPPALPFFCIHAKGPWEYNFYYYRICTDSVTGQQNPSCRSIAMNMMKYLWDTPRLRNMTIHQCERCHKFEKLGLLHGSFKSCPCCNTTIYCSDQCKRDDATLHQQTVSTHQSVQIVTGPDAGPQQQQTTMNSH